MSMSSISVLDWGADQTAEVVLSILLESFAFKLSETSIRWNTASVHYPSSMTSDKAQLPLKVKRLVRA